MRPSAASSSGSARSRVSRPPGLQWHLPWPIESAEKINTGATEPLNYRASMLTRDENIVNVALVVQFRRTDPQSFLFNMRNPEATLEAATASAIREVIGRNVLDFILTDGRAEVSQQAQDLLQATLDSYEAGITIYEVNLVNAEFPARSRWPCRTRSGPAKIASDAFSKLRPTRTKSCRERAARRERRRQDAEAYRAQVDRGCGGRVGPVHADPRRVRESAGRHARAPVHRNARGGPADLDEGARRHRRRQQPPVPAARSARRAPFDASDCRAAGPFERCAAARPAAPLARASGMQRGNREPTHESTHESAADRRRLGRDRDPDVRVHRRCARACREIPDRPHRPGGLRAGSAFQDSVFRERRSLSEPSADLRRGFARAFPDGREEEPDRRLLRELAGRRSGPVLPVGQRGRRHRRSCVWRRSSRKASGSRSAAERCKRSSRRSAPSSWRTCSLQVQERLAGARHPSVGRARQAHRSRRRGQRVGFQPHESGARRASRRSCEPKARRNTCEFAPMPSGSGP